MKARAEIFGRIAAGLGKGDFAARRARIEAALADGGRGPQPAFRGDLSGRFAERAASLSSTVEHLSGTDEAPAAVARYLALHGLGTRIVLAADLAGLDWTGAGLDAIVRRAEDADTVGVTGCFCAIAETGTLLLLSGPQTPASLSLLPETHIALVPAARIVPTMEDAFALLRAECGTMPRAVNFVSGPSRTGDIEQTIVLGAHGPCRVHLMITGACP